MEAVFDSEAFEGLRELVGHAGGDEGGELLACCGVACVIVCVAWEEGGGAREGGVGIRGVWHDD